MFKTANVKRQRQADEAPDRSDLSAQIQMMLAHGEFGPVNLDSNLWRIWPATLVTSASEHNGHSDFGSNDCLART